MGHVGFGSYRISIRSKEHCEALVLALQSGCKLIDTSANYTNGESEELIGYVLEKNPQFKLIIVTKAGYIQGKNLKVIEELNASGKAIEDLVEISEDLKHSIHPDFLEDQLSRSLSRLKKKSVDIFLLHNPEYYFKTKDANQAEYYQRIKKAFIYLETEVEKGRILSYGISSNNFVLPLTSKDVTNLSSVIKIAKSLGTNNHFTTIQFPFNLIEIGALEKFGEYGDESLIELAKNNHLMTLSNRPLNAFTENELVRLATYEFMTSNLDEEIAEKQFLECMSSVEAKWQEALIDDEQASGEKFSEVTLIKQFSGLWKTLTSPDAVEEVYFAHFFPFIARVWGGSGLSPEDAAPFYKLMDYSLLFARKNMTSKAQSFKLQAENVGLIPIETNQPFAVDVIETYLNYGIDYVLLGMKKPEYVSQVKHLF
jgi:aryl-alcohol dehydrogenase-like predicted oxidoreductase